MDERQADDNHHEFHDMEAGNNYYSCLLSPQSHSAKLHSVIEHADIIDTPQVKGFKWRPAMPKQMEGDGHSY